MPKRIKRIWNVVSTVLVVIAVVFALLLVGVRAAGIQVYSVISGSMEPKYPVGSLIYVKKADPAQVKVGDAITFVLSNGMPATHRVIAIDYERQCFRTRGDANYDRKHFEQTGEKIYTEDPPVAFQNLIGKPVFHIPLLGYAAYYIQHPPGRYIAIAAGAVLLMLAFLPDLWGKKTKEEESSREHSGEKAQG